MAAQGSKYATIWLNVSEFDMNIIISEFTIISRF